MMCPACGQSSPVATGRCASCGAEFAATLAATMLTLDTIGRPQDIGIGAGATRSIGGLTLTPTGLATVEPEDAEPETKPTRSAGPLTVGQSFGPRYHIIKLLGAGGMGAVYQAWDAELSVAVALKVIRTERRRVSADVEKQFKNELLLARQVTHKNVVRIHDLGEIDGIKYITMPYVQGDDLATVLRRDGKVPIKRALRIARQIASGLEAAHEAGVIHRDLKPENIMIAGAGDDAQAQIMDFGISSSTQETNAGRIVGTLEYMAPEQGSGDPVDQRADIYAYGLILYEMLTGPRAAAGAQSMTPQERFTAMRERFARGVPPIKTVDASIPEPLAAIVTKCLANDPADRFESAAQLTAALALLDDEGKRIPIAARLTKRMVAAAALVVVLLLGGTYYVAKQLATPSKPHEPVSVLIADVRNDTGDSSFTGTLEPMLRRALEGAGFVSAYEKSRIRSTLGVRPPDRLDEAAARELALKQGLGVVLSGAIERQGRGYAISVKALQTVTGNVIASASSRASTKDQVLGTATRLMAAVRRGLGDKSSDADQIWKTATLSASSLEVVRYYASAVDAATNNKYEEARQSYLKAVELDPNFGMAYQGLAVVSGNMGRLQERDRYIQQALRHLDGMTERERYGTRGYYYRATGDYQQCVKEYGELIARYAGDAIAHNQRALCLSKLRNMREAVDEMRQSVAILPKRVLFRGNLALYADYAGEFRTGEQEARAVQEPDLYAMLAIAFAQVGQGQLQAATETYQKLGAMGARGASWTASGLADIALYQGRFSDAILRLQEGAAADLANRNPDKAARKLTSLAYVYLSAGRDDQAVKTAETALANSHAAEIRFLTARIFVEAGAIAKAQALARGLGSELPAEPHAYGRLVEGEIALKQGDARQAVKILTEANAALDTWIGHFDLGRAYLAAGAFPQADSEFDRCIKRRGEALALLADEEPTYGYLPSVYYYQGRVREALNNAGFADAYREYLGIRGDSTEDPLVREVRRRASQ